MKHLYVWLAVGAAVVIALVLVLFQVSDFKNYEDLLSMGNITKPKGNLQFQEAFNNWKTYRNEEYGFEFKYPGEWLVKHQIVEKNLTIGIYPLILEPNACGSLNLEVINLVGQKEYLDNLRSNYTELDSMGKVLIGSQEFEEYWFHNVVAGPGAGVGKIDIFNNEKKSFIFSFGTNCYDKKDELYDFSKINNRILATFKFINSADTTNWKTYRNEQLGFEFEYPPTLKLDEIRPVNEINGEFEVSIGLEIPPRVEGEMYYPSGPIFSILISRNAELPSKWLINYLKNYAYQMSDIIDITFLGKPAAQLVSPNTSSTFYKLLVISDEGKIYFISMTEEAKQILSTFKFIK